MFEDSAELVADYLKHKNVHKFEHDLVKSKSLKKDNQLILIDDRALTLTSLDLHLGKLKARFGNKLTVCVVDYLNQIVVEGVGSQFDWQPQVVVSKKLKDLARKHDVVMFSPYQTDAAGEARFAKGILDAADIAMLMEIYDKDKNMMGFNTTKIRSGPPMRVTSGINWETLKISATPIANPEEEPKVKRNKKAQKEPVAAEPASDVPWN